MTRDRIFYMAVDAREAGVSVDRFVEAMILRADMDFVAEVVAEVWGGR